MSSARKIYNAWWLKSYFFYLFKKGVERTIQEEQLKMNFVKSFIIIIIIMLALLTSTAHSGLLTYTTCIGGCNVAWFVCVTTAGGVPVPLTGGVVVPVAIITCDAAYALCVGACSGTGFLPTA